MSQRNTIETVASQIEILDNGCWFWRGWKDKFGYGSVNWDGKMARVHRLVWEYLVCEIPDGLVLDHLCRNPSCCNVGHLEMVTQAENALRGEVGKLNREKTHCRHGHPYSSENTYYITRGNGKRFRVCKTCQHASKERYEQKKNAAQ
jgi:hypothetical protein